MHCRIFRSILGLYQLDGSSTPSLSYDNQKYLQTSLNVPLGGWQNCPYLRTVGLRREKENFKSNYNAVSAMIQILCTGREPNKLGGGGWGGRGSGGKNKKAAFTRKRYKIKTHNSYLLDVYYVLKH